MPEIDYSALFAAMPGCFCLLVGNSDSEPDSYRIADLSSACRDIPEFAADGMQSGQFCDLFECLTVDGLLPAGSGDFVIEHSKSQQRWHVHIAETTDKIFQQGGTARLLQFIRRATEPDRHALVDQALAAIESHIYVLDAEGRFLYANRAILELHGLAADDALGRSFYDLGYDQLLADKLMSQVAVTVATGEPLIDQASIVAVDGSTRHFEYRWTPLAAEDGRITAIAGATHDITARTLIQEQLAVANVNSASASIAKSEFLANMSHEIRSPMTAILGFTDILSRHLESSDNLAAVETIRRNGQHLLQIINDMLDLSHIETGRMSIDTSPIETDELITDLHAVMLSQSSGKQIEISLECFDLLPVAFNSDGKRVRQILTSLISNACKFTDSGSVKLGIEAQQLSDGTPTLLFKIMDTGIGLTPEALSTVFDPFSQADSSHSRRYDGAGLGLSISRRLAQLLHGDISAESRPGRGSCFSLRLPLSPSAMQSMRRPAPRVHSGASHHEKLSSLSCHLLIVDDRSDVRFVMQQMLEIAGARVTGAGDGLEAISLVKAAMTHKHPYDLVLMDMQMPVMDGYEAARRLRQLGYENPILALTAAALQTDRDRCLEAGCDDHLSKPIEAAVLVERIQFHLQQFNARKTGADAVLSERSAGAANSDRTDSNGPLRVLLVEDNEDVRQATATLLRAAGCEVAEAATGAETLKYTASTLPDAIILDLGLPDMSGYDVADRVRQLPGGDDCLIYVMSGRKQNDDRAATARIDRHLLKPVSWDKIRGLLGT